MHRAKAPESHILYYMCVLCFLSLIVAILVALIFNKTMELVPEFIEAEIHCLTPKCLQTSAHLLNMIDPHVKPCDDMYQHACGGWMRKHVIPTDHEKWNRIGETGDKVENILVEILQSNNTKLKGSTSSALGKLMTYYRSCIDVKTINAKAVARLSALINSFGSWTLTSNEISTWNEATWSLQSVMEKVATLDLGVFFSLENYPDVKNGAMFLPAFTGPVFTSSPLFLLGDSGLAEVLKTSSHLLEKFDPNFNASMLSDVLEFEKKLMMLKQKHPWTDLRKASPITLATFLASFGTWIDLKKYLKAFYGRDIPPTTSLYCTSLEYYKELDKVISATNKELLANYINWHVFSKFRSSANYVNINEESRWKTCLGTLRQYMGFALSAPFVEAYFPVETRDQITEMFTKIKAQVSQSVKKLTLDKVAKEGVLKKVEAMNILSGYPDWIVLAHKLDEFYKSVDVKDGELFNSHLSLVRRSHALLAADTLSTFDKNRWMFSPDEVKVMYHRSSNTIVVTAAFLHPVEHLHMFPPPYVYGSVGFAIAHEMTHAFDSDGIFLDEKGAKHNIQSAEIAEYFKKRSTCFLVNYGNYTVGDFPLNSLSSLNENIADNSGVQVAFMAYKTVKVTWDKWPGLNYTDNQLFFLGYSQAFCAISEPPIEALLANNAAHAPERIRVNGSLSGSAEFLDAFTCPSSALFKLRSKCKVF